MQKAISNHGAGGRGKYLLLFLYLAVTFVLIIHHENWRDEAQAWLLVKQLTPSGAFSQLSFEGHPFLYYLILMPFAKAGLPFITVNFLSMAVMGAAAWFLLFRSPFGLATDAAVLISPLFIYYWSVFGRSYCLLLLFLVLLASVYPVQKERPYLYCALIALLLQVHVMIAATCFMLSLLFFLDALKDRNVRRIKALALPFASALIYLVEFRNIRYAVYQKSALKDTSAGGILLHLGKGMYRAAKQLFGDSKLVILLIAVLAAFIFITFLVRKMKGRAAVLTALVSIAYILYLLIFRYYMMTRYLLIIPAVLLFALWIFVEENAGENVGERKLPADPCLLCGVLLIVMSVSSAAAHGAEVNRDYYENYSDAKDTAAYIRTLDASVPLAESESDFVNSVAAYLGDREIFNPYEENTDTFAVRDTRKIRNFTIKEFVSRIRKAYPEKEGVYLIYDQTSEREGEQSVTDGMADYVKNLKCLYSTQEISDAMTMRRDGVFSVYYLPLKNE